MRRDPSGSVTRGQARELCLSSAPHPRMGTVCSLPMGCHGLEMGWPGRSVQHKAPPRMEVNFLHSCPFFCEPHRLTGQRTSLS